MDKKGQVTVFIIIAILIVGAAASFFVFRDKLIKKSLPSDFEEVYNNFLFCLEEDLSTGINVLESQGGYIYLPEFESGSEQYPFSSQLNFLGNPIPYWYYVTNNGFSKTQVPSKNFMEDELGTFVESQINNCFLDKYYDDGFEITYGEADAKAEIKSNKVILNLNMDFVIEKAGEKSSVKNSRIEVDSDLGSLYDSALKVYNSEQENLFLEEYAIDNLRLYVPVDGVELSCSPKVWEANEIFDDLQEAIEINTLALKSSGEADDYFNLNLNSDVRFVNSKNWPSSFEVLPSEENFLIANPVGSQAGLGVLGFCYVPYHFVYNVKYPVLVQVYSGVSGEVFQFPLAVIIEGNKERKALEGTAVGLEDSELCKYKNTLTNVNVYDENLQKIDADISYECLRTTCKIGKTSEGNLYEEFPQCVNGYVLARADGFEDAKILHSTIESGLINIYLQRNYDLEVELNLDGVSYNSQAIVNFISDDSSTTIVYPDEKLVELGEGDYEIEVQIYSDASLEIAATTKEQCLEVAQGGIGGLLGLTKEECFEIDIPEQIVSSALSGGGSKEIYFSNSELKNSDVIEINAQTLPKVDSLDQLQENYILIESKELGVSLR